MTISTLFFIFLATFVVSVIVALINFFFLSKNMFDGVARFDIDSSFKSMYKGIGIHIIFGGLAAIASLGTLVTGIIWIVQTFKA